MAKNYGTPADIGGKNESISVSTRKIDNGYIVSRSRSSDDSYECSESYSPTKPDISLTGKAKAQAEGPSPLRQAIDSIPNE